MVNPKKQVSKKIVLFVLFPFLVLLIYISIYYYRTISYQPMLSLTAQPLVIEIKPKTSAVTLVNQLYSLHLISSKNRVLAFIRLRGLANHLQAGIYQINPGETVPNFIKRVAKGDVLLEPFRILEGSTLFDLQRSLTQAPYLNFNHHDFAIFAQTHASAEGLFLADTYFYKAGSNANSLLKQAHQNLLQYLEKIWQQRTPTLPYKNSYELLIAASIIEKEASVPFERQLIAGIIVNRLKLHMPLQMDPTVIYALTKLKANAEENAENKQPIILRRDDLKINSPYNTYYYRGLPPTPIAMVSKQSLDAAAHPDPTSYLYFFAKGDGTHQFSKTYAEHQQAIHQFKLRATVHEQ